MLQQRGLAAVLGILLAAATSFAATDDDLPYVTVTLDDFARASIHKRGELTGGSVFVAGNRADEYRKKLRQQ